MIGIGHCQSECLAGDFAGNFAKEVAGLERAADGRVWIVSLPEIVLTGCRDRAEEACRSAFSIASLQMQEVLERTPPFDATFMVGFNEAPADGRYDTALVARGGERRTMWPKWRRWAVPTVL